MVVVLRTTAATVFFSKATESVPPIAVPSALPPPVATPTEPVTAMMSASVRAFTSKVPVCLKLLSVSTVEVVVFSSMAKPTPTP